MMIRTDDYEFLFIARMIDLENIYYIKYDVVYCVMPLPSIHIDAKITSK